MGAWCRVLNRNVVLVKGCSEVFMSKTCIKCGELKEDTEFYTKKNTCKVCFIKQVNTRHWANREASLAYKKQNYAEHKEEYYQYSVNRRKELRIWLNTLKTGPCCDCGGYFPPVCYDFHHTDPKGKISTVALMFMRCSKTQILAEIEKCVLICANCHRIRTAKQNREEKLHQKQLRQKV